MANGVGKFGFRVVARLVHYAVSGAQYFLRSSCGLLSYIHISLWPICSREEDWRKTCRRRRPARSRRNDRPFFLPPLRKFARAIGDRSIRTSRLLADIRDAESSSRFFVVVIAAIVSFRCAAQGRLFCKREIRRRQNTSLIFFSLFSSLSCFPFVRLRRHFNSTRIV